MIRVRMRAARISRRLSRVVAAGADRVSGVRRGARQTVAPQADPQPVDLASLVLPAGRIAALALLNSPDVRIQSLASLVASDPGLAIIVLRAANSAESASRRRIADPGEAVVRVGLNQTKRLVAAAVVGGALSSLKGCGLDLEAFWSYSLASAIATEDEADTQTLRAGAFSVGLLHDVGRLALAASGPQTYARRSTAGHSEHVILAAERIMFGENHATASARLLESVGLPDEFVEMVASHHGAPGRDPDSPLSRARRLVAAAGFSDGLPLHLESVAVPGVDLRRASSLLDHVEWYRSALHSSDHLGRIQAAPSHDFASESDPVAFETGYRRRYASGVNRRAVFRALAIAQASLYTIVGDRLASAYAGTIRDVSLEGAGLTLPASRLFPGDRVAVGFALDGEQYWLRSEVRWIHTSRQDRGQELGVSFDPLSAADQRRLWAQISDADRSRRPIGPVDVPLGVAAWQPRRARGGVPVS
jgi:putative nucleotidyltransferase with HDIG domain